MATRAYPRTWLGLSWLAAVPLLAGCEPTPTPGGQSGTEGDGTSVDDCKPTEPRCVTPDEVLPYFERSLNDLAATIAGITAPAMPGSWKSTRTRAELSVVIPPDASARQVSRLRPDGSFCDSVLELERLDVHSSDGVIDAQVPARLSAPGSGHGLSLDATLPALPDGYVVSAILSPDVASYGDLNLAQFDRATTLRMGINEWFSPAYAEAAILADQRIASTWSTRLWGVPLGDPIAYTPSEPFVAECAGAEDFVEYRQVETPFSSAAAALQGIARTWLRCRDNVVSSHAGLQILPDGTWHHVQIEGGELVARYGFEHEGFVESSYNSGPGESPDPQGPGPYQTELRPFGRRYDANLSFGPDMTTWASEEALVFRGFGPNWPPAVYLPTTAPVRSAGPEYADGERAGAAACEHVEQGIVSTNADWASILTGDFVLCSGSLRDGLARIHFDESSLTLLRADGTVILTQTYDEPIAALIRGARFQYPPELDWWVEASRSPLKLWISESSDTRLNAAIFSALP